MASLAFAGDLVADMLGIAVDEAVGAMAASVADVAIDGDSSRGALAFGQHRNYHMALGSFGSTVAAIDGRTCLHCLDIIAERLVATNIDRSSDYDEHSGVVGAVAVAVDELGIDPFVGYELIACDWPSATIYQILRHQTMGYGMPAIFFRYNNELAPIFQQHSMVLSDGTRPCVCVCVLKIHQNDSSLPFNLNKNHTTTNDDKQKNNRF